MFSDFLAKMNSNFSLTINECTSKAIFQSYISWLCLPGNKQTFSSLSITNGRMCFAHKKALFLGLQHHILYFH